MNHDDVTPKALLMAEIKPEPKPPNGGETLAQDELPPGLAPFVLRATSRSAGSAPAAELSSWVNVRCRAG